jgi:adenosylhomocysteine nucleosidase
MTEARLADLVERAFDYRGYVTVRRNDGSELVGFVYDRGPSHLELFDETATKRVRVDLDQVVDIAFTGEDAARKSQEIWERRKGKLEPRDTPAWGEWHDAGPLLLIVALEIELRSVARVLGARVKGDRVRGRIAGCDVVGLAIGAGGGARRAIADERPRLVVSCGFSGALDGKAAPGDLVLGTRVHDESGGELAPAPALLRAAAQALTGLPHLEGELLCTTAVAASGEEKRALARPGVVALDMESYPVARAAVDAGVPWLALRAIVDPLESSLPPFTRDARRSFVWPAVKHALSGPAAVVELIRLQGWARKASAALETSLRRLAPALGSLEARP